uniref:CUB domain-containing protein n=1 Tax=Romanomermis culicivorax TaxID=13658 RepID=A0A915JAM0_ROMCU
AAYKQKQEVLNNRSLCPSYYQDVFSNGTPIPYDGSNICQIFAVRAYGNYMAIEKITSETHNTTGPWTPDVDHITCTNLQCGANSTNPGDVSFSYIVHFDLGKTFLE